MYNNSGNQEGLPKQSVQFKGEFHAHDCVQAYE
jgi:hypothetical protein